MIKFVLGKILMGQKIFHQFGQFFFLKIILKSKFFLYNQSKLPGISLDIRDIFKNLSLKSEHPLNRGLKKLEKNLGPDSAVSYMRIFLK